MTSSPVGPPSAASSTPGASRYGDLDVLRVLRARRAAADVPARRRDPHRVALVIGGGGMRGAYVAGMVLALDRAGLTPGFDEVYATSSGAFIGAPLLTGQAADCAASFATDLATRRFIDIRRLGTRRPVVSLDHLLVAVLEGSRPFPFERLGAGPVPLNVIATAVDDLRPHVLAPVSVPEWKAALRATAAIPLLAGPPVALHGRHWIDGSVGEPLATVRALRAGATHVLTLLCRGEHDLHPDTGARLSLWARLLNRAVPGLGTVAQGSRRYGADLRIITDAMHPDRGPAHLLAIGPAQPAGVGAFTVDPAAVAEAVRVGAESIAAAVAAADAPDPQAPAIA